MSHLKREGKPWEPHCCVNWKKEADRRGLPFLQLDSSLTAEAFYKARGYEVQGRSEHVLRSGQRMTCVQMRKQFIPAI